MTRHDSEKITKLKKRTNVRARLFQLGLKTLQAIDGSLAASAMEQIFLKVQRHRAPAREEAWMADAQRFDLRYDGRRLATLSWGRGPVVLLAHGWAGRGSQLGAFAGPLVERGFRVVTWDAPGHGFSSDRLTSIPAIRDAVLAVAEAAGPVHAVIAHSAGSVGTTLACHRGLQVDRLVYLAPVLDPGSFLPEIAETLGLRPEIATMTRSRIEKRVGERFETLSRLTAASPESLPLLVIHDRLDREIPWENGKQIAENWPGARWICTQGLGHRRILRDDAVVASVIDFVCQHSCLHGTNDLQGKSQQAQASS